MRKISRRRPKAGENFKAFVREEEGTGVFENFVREAGGKRMILGTLIKTTPSTRSGGQFFQLISVAR